MSETNTVTEPVPNAPSVDPPAPAPDPAPAPAPPEPTEQTEEEKKQLSRGDRRWAQVTAQLAAAQRVQAQQAAELEFLRQERMRLQPPTAEETPEQAQARLVAQIRQEEAGKLRAQQFHEVGRAEFPDWQQRCTALMSMGADAGFAALLVDTPGGAKVAAALADDPEEVQRIASIPSERGRAVALGRYAATLETASAAPKVVPVTRAPAPVRPVTGRAAPQFNEYTATAQELADHYMKQNLERQMQQRRA
jgi:hypothetical protein